MTTLEVRRAEVADERHAADVLASAFSADPLLTWIVGNRPDIERRLRRMFTPMLSFELAKDSHAVDMLEGGGAVALWHAVDDWKTPNRELVRAIPSIVGALGRRVPRALRVLSTVERAHPETPHRHLAYVGVQHEHQGRGLGSALLRAAAEECDDEGVGAYLENSNPRNEALYARYGFVPTAPIALPRGGPPLIAMWRDPR